MSALFINYYVFALHFAVAAVFLFVTAVIWEHVFKQLLEAYYNTGKPVFLNIIVVWNIFVAEVALHIVLFFLFPTIFAVPLSIIHTLYTLYSIFSSLLKVLHEYETSSTKSKQGSNYYAQWFYISSNTIKSRSWMWEELLKDYEYKPGDPLLDPRYYEFMDASNFNTALEASLISIVSTSAVALTTYVLFPRANTQNEIPWTTLWGDGRRQFYFKRGFGK